MSYLLLARAGRSVQHVSYAGSAESVNCLRFPIRQSALIPDIVVIDNDGVDLHEHGIAVTSMEPGSPIREDLMQNFDFHNPTRVVFGEGTISRLADLVPADARILLTYGGGSIKRNGVHDQVMAALQDHDVLEFGGIESNPSFETCMGAVHLCRRENVAFLLAVGGAKSLIPSPLP